MPGPGPALPPIGPKLSEALPDACTHLHVGADRPADTETCGHMTLAPNRHTPMWSAPPHMGTYSSTWADAPSQPEHGNPEWWGCSLIPCLPCASLRPVRPPLGRAGWLGKREALLCPVLGGEPPLSSGAAASWAPGLAWLAQEAPWGLTGSPWAVRRAHRCHCSQDQARFRLVQV